MSEFFFDVLMLLMMILLATTIKFLTDSTSWFIYIWLGLNLEKYSWIIGSIWLLIFSLLILIKGEKNDLF